MEIEKFAKTALVDLLGDQPDEIIFERTSTQLRVRARVKETWYPVVPADLAFMRTHFDWPDDVIAVFHRQLQTHYRNHVRDGIRQLRWERTGDVLRLTWRELVTQA